MAYRILPDQAYLAECFDYDPDTGQLRWRYRPAARAQWNSKHAGKVAGSISPKGYISISMEWTRFLAHRVIFKLMTGSDPIEEVDHINRDKTDNRWSNLRAASSSQNRCNEDIRASNTTGFKGVSFHKARKKYRATIDVGGKARHLGLFPTAIEAHAAYRAATLIYRDQEFQIT